MVMDLLLLPDVVRQAPRCHGQAESGNWFISARAEGDMAFIWSDWQRGIEPLALPSAPGWEHMPPKTRWPTGCSIAAWCGRARRCR